MYYGPESMKSEGMLAVEITENDRQQCSCLKILGVTHETLKWKLFPFSLLEEAKQWYIRVVGCVNGS